MKSYLKPCTACTKVETEGYLLAGTGGGHNGSFRSKCPPQNPSIGQSNDWGPVKLGAPSSAVKENYFIELED